jgi:3-hydroxyacyl-[acyl-carrier-protein] dehydratase
MSGPVSPVAGEVRVVTGPRLEGKTWHSETSFDVSPDEPVFAGHYPGSPIFPGVCLVECVRRSALATVPAEAGYLELAGLESARFAASVSPGDRLEIALKWQSDDEGWRCSAQIDNAFGKAASVRLRFTGQGVRP